MDMVRRDMSLANVHPGFLAFLADDGADPFGNLTAQHLMAILGDPDDMEVDGKCRMGAMTIVTHAPQSTKNLLKLPPKQIVRFYAAICSCVGCVSFAFCSCL